MNYPSHIAVAGATGLVGRQLVAAARAGGHEVLELSRSTGTDLVTGPPPDLTGVDVVIDVTQGSDHDERAIGFFEAVAATLGEACRAAGVGRTVMLSIVGVELAAGEIPYYAAKVAHERATRAAALDTRILRATQFHDFPRQLIEWRAADGQVQVADQRIQPVAVTEIVRVLLELALADDAPEVTNLAGPREERLVELVGQVDPAIEVVTVPAGPAVAAGALLPGPDAVIAGTAWTVEAARGSVV